MGRPASRAARRRPGAVLVNPTRRRTATAVFRTAAMTWADEPARSRWASSLMVTSRLRDTLYQEDKSQVRTRSGPRIMAALRNLAICALRLLGRTDVTEATRWAGRSMDRPFAILGLTS